MLSTWPTSSRLGARSTQLYFFLVLFLKTNVTDKLLITNRQIYTPKQELNPQPQLISIFSLIIYLFILIFLCTSSWTF